MSTASPLILVVDDDRPILTLMASLLGGYGFQTRLAATGSEAIEAVRERVPDLIILDKKMPGMSGSEVVQKLKSEPGLAEVPILLLSGEPVDPDEVAGLGVNGAVQKPFDIPELIEQIRSFTGTTRT